MLQEGMKVAGDHGRAAGPEGLNPAAVNMTGDSGFGFSNSASGPKTAHCPVLWKSAQLPASSPTPTPTPNLRSLLTCVHYPHLGA